MIDLEKESANFQITLLKTATFLNQTTNKRNVELLFKKTLEKTIPTSVISLKISASILQFLDEEGLNKDEISQCGGLIKIAIQTYLQEKNVTPIPIEKIREISTDETFLEKAKAVQSGEKLALCLPFDGILEVLKKTYHVDFSKDAHIKLQKIYEASIIPDRVFAKLCETHTKIFLGKIIERFTLNQISLTKDQILAYLLKRLSAENEILERLLTKIDSNDFFQKYLQNSIASKKNKRPMAYILHELIGPTVHETIQEWSEEQSQKDFLPLRPDIIQERYRELILGTYLHRVERNPKKMDHDLAKLKFFAIPVERRIRGILSEDEQILKKKVM